MSNCPFCGEPDSSANYGGHHVCVLTTPSRWVIESEGEGVSLQVVLRHVSGRRFLISILDHHRHIEELARS